MSVMGILTDVTKCIGCEECVSACKETNKTGKDKPWRWQKKIDDLSATRWTTIIPLPNKHYVRQQCRHCLEPACVSACIVGALYKTEEGSVVYNSDICLGCRYCMMACPFAIPRYLWNEPVHYVRKCIMCHEKISSGEIKQPACTAACPQEATIFGERDELLKIAHKRIADNPGKYIDRVWGEKEIGGTSVMYLSDVPLDFLGLQKDLGNKPLPKMTWDVLNKVPSIFLGMGAAMYGTYWFIERKEKIAAQAAKEAESRPDPEPEQEKE